MEDKLSKQLYDEFVSHFSSDEYRKLIEGIWEISPNKKQDEMKKQIECLDCGKIGLIEKKIPIKFSWCPFCRSANIRLYPPRKKRKK